MSATQTSILDTAERLIRAGGYNHCSFRDIAAEVGIKSASVHHHFATKADLAVAVTRRYTERFIHALGEPKVDGQTPRKQIVRYCESFRSAYKKSRCACLCGILCGEVGLLPEAVQTELAVFISANVQWLSSVLETLQPQPTLQERRQIALHIYSSMQGAMHVAAALQNEDWLKTVTQSVVALVPDSN
jgi:TetR/AcrR family transcriptional repressor of nem operon